MSARITWYKRLRKSVHLRSTCTIESLMVEIKQLKNQNPKKKKKRDKLVKLKNKCRNIAK